MPYVIRNWKVSKRYADFERDPQYTTKHTGKIKYIYLRPSKGIRDNLQANMHSKKWTSLLH